MSLRLGRWKREEGNREAQSKLNLNKRPFDTVSLSY